MVVLNRIYTRTGDDGTTSLGSGDRRKKYDLRVEAYGTLDEVNAVVGIVRLHTAADAACSTRRWRASRTTCSTSKPTCACPRRGRAARG
jgi:cob(I)alamin adenosyltransferase